MAAIVGALESALLVGGVSAIGAGLVSLGIPKNSVLTYETEVKAGKYLVIAHGTADDAARAKSILNASTPGTVTDHALASA